MKKAFTVIVRSTIYDWQNANLVYSSYREAKRNIKELNNLSEKNNWKTQYKIVFEK